MRPNVERLLDLNEIAIFSCVAEEASLTRAARRLGLPKSTVSRKLTALEERLRARLLHRNPRRVELTDAGRALHIEARTALAQLGDAAERVSELGDALHGKVRVAAPNDFGVAVCSPLFCEFARRYPEITLELSLSDHTVDLVHDGFDLAIRVGRVSDPALVARQVGAIRGHLVAAPEYARSRPMPATPEELPDHPFVEFVPSLAHHGFVRLFGKGGAMLDVPVRAVLRANSVAVVREAVLAGLGIARLPTYMSAKLVASGRLVHVLTDYWTGERAVHLVHTGRRLLPARVKLLLDFLAAELTATVA
jgi:DNA-binding transcriptional LysR family regulator